MTLSLEELERYEETPVLVPTFLCKEGDTGLCTYEIDYSNGDSSIVEGSVNGVESIDSWFEKGKQVHPGPRLRLLYGAISDSTVPFTRRDCVSISDHLDLDLDRWVGMRDDFLSPASFWCDRREDSKGCQGFFVKTTMNMLDQTTWIRAHVNCCVYIHHRPSTNTTTGLLLMNSYVRTLPMSLVRDSVLLVQSWFEKLHYHPLSCGLAICKQAMVENQGQLAYIKFELNRLSEDLGYSGPTVHDDMMEREGFDLVQNTGKVQRSREFNAIARDLICRSQALTKRIMAVLEDQRATATEDEKIVLADIRAEFLHVDCGNEAAISRVNATDLDLNSFSQALFNYMSIREGRVNQQLAKSSKEIAEATAKDSAAMREIAALTRKDSSAMKSIAVLTMVFLPATAVASILETPFFSFDDASGRLSTKGFQFFWAITIPLTVSVLIVWRIGVTLNWTVWLSNVWSAWMIWLARIFRGRRKVVIEGVNMGSGEDSKAGESAEQMV